MIVKTEQFEGPLDLLLELIEKNKLDITRLSLARVAEEFVERMESQKDMPIEQLADFLDIGARLLLLKSKAILPVLEFTEEEEAEILDLEERLRIHAIFKEKAKEFGLMTVEGQRFFGRDAYVGLSHMFVPDITKLVLTGEHLQLAIEKLLASLPDPEKLKEKILRKTIRLEEKIRRLKMFIEEKSRFLFSDVVVDRSDRGEVVVSFLAILELVRQQHMTVHQEEFFGDIYVSRHIDSVVANEEK